MKKIICFGDTLTEMGYLVEVRGFVAQLADRYSRRADVLARGFAGYTTREALQILQEAVLDEKPEIVIVFFGSNDSVLPGQITHVPLEEFKNNMLELAGRIACEGAWVLIVTPPPVDEKRVKSRTMEHTVRYAQACMEVAQEMNLPLVNLFEALQEEPEWAKTCFADGLHLSAAAMNRLYSLIAAQLDHVEPIDRFKRLAVDGI